MNILHQNSRIDLSYYEALADKLKIGLRRIGCYRTVQKGRAILLFDVAFFLDHIDINGSIHIYINKKYLPKDFELDQFFNLRPFLQQEIGLPLDIQFTKKEVVLVLYPSSYDVLLNRLFEEEVIFQ